jgi:hypothetical protein
MIKIKIMIGIFLLSGVAFLIKSDSASASPSPELGVFIVQPSTSLLSSSVPPSNPAERFTLIGHACGNGTLTGYTTYDGKRLALHLSGYTSSSELRQEFQKWLQDATRIQETGAKYNRQGKIVGKRVIAFFGFGDKETAAILWTEQKSLRMIEAQSLDQALEFERTKIE